MPGPTGRNPTTIHSSGAPAMSDGPFGVEPKILKLPNGLLVLSTGRLGQFLWVADDPPQAWTSWNVAKHHNDHFVKGAPPGGEAIYHNLTFFDESDGPSGIREREDFPRSGRAPPLSWNAAGSGTTACESVRPSVYLGTCIHLSAPAAAASCLPGPLPLPPCLTCARTRLCRLPPPQTLEWPTFRGQMML